MVTHTRSLRPRPPRVVPCTSDGCRGTIVGCRVRQAPAARRRQAPSLPFFRPRPLSPLNGEIDIVATVIENGVTATAPTTPPTPATPSAGAGTPVQNGTLVSFTTTIGRIEPREARTHNGQVRVKFIANGQSGTATITAYSGGTSGKLENLLVGFAAAERILVSAQNLGPSGGSTPVTARVESAAGVGLAGIPVQFSTSTGTVNPTTVTTDANGVATTTLTSNVAATVTATAGSKTGTASVALGARLIASFTALPQATSVGAPIQFTVTSGTGANVSNASIQFGDGRTVSLGSFSGEAHASYAYSSSGNYTATATASDALGNVQSQSTTVTIGTLPITLTFSPTTPTRGTPITFTVGGVGTAQVGRYDWFFNDGDTRSTSGPQTSKSFDSAGTKVVRVDIIGVNGSVIATQSITLFVS